MVFYLIGLIIYLAQEWGIHVDIHDIHSAEYTPLFSSSFVCLSGMLALGLFIHNAIITITSNNEYQENNVSENPSWLLPSNRP